MGLVEFWNLDQLFPIHPQQPCFLKLPVFIPKEGTVPATEFFRKILSTSASLGVEEPRASFV